MVMTDPVADMLTRVRNANVARHEKLELPASKLKTELADILKREGFVRDYEVKEDSKQGVLRIYMTYGAKKESVITGLRSMSKAGIRLYANAKEGPRVLNGLCIAVVSTSHGLLSDKEARTQAVGGEVLAYIW